MATPTRVLLVEDDPDVRLITKLSLELDAEMVVHEAVTASEALSILQGAIDLPSVLLLGEPSLGVKVRDFMDNIATDPRRAEIPIVFLTSRIGTHDIDAMFAAGAIGVLTKPFNPISLAAELRALLRG